MIDQTSQFFAILTHVGAAKQANADALGVAWKIAQMGVGDANGTDPVPDASQLKLINERRRAPLNQLKVDPANNAIIIAEQVIPAEVGGFWIREIALYDSDGDMVAVANCAPSYKPALTQGSGRTQIVRINLLVSNTSNVELKIDHSVVLATRAYVDAKILDEIFKLDNKQSAVVATTGNIALSGLQTVDGEALVTGDRVLVRAQMTARDNGIYIAASGPWARAQDADGVGEVTSAMQVSVERGATLADTRWQLITDGAIFLGTTELTFQNVTFGFAPIESPALVNPTGNTPPQFDNSLRLQTTAFAKRMGVEYSNVFPLTASSELGPASIGGIVSAASATPISITMPSTSFLPDGAALQLVNAGVGIVSLLPAATDVLASQAGARVSIALGLGDTAELVKVSGSWRLRGGSAALKYSNVMAGAEWTTAAQFDNSKRLATTEFIKRSGVEWSNFNSVAVNTVLGLDSIGGVISAASASAINVTLPATSRVPYGAAVMIISAGSGGVTVLVSGNDTLTNQSGFAVPIVLGQGDSALLSRVTGEWRLIGGTAALKHSAVFAGAFAGVTGSSGRQRMPTGMLMQWVTVAVPTGGQGNISSFSWPISFDNGVRAVGFAPDFTVSEYGYITLVVGARSKQGGQLLNLGQTLKLASSAGVTIIAIGD
ncbi:phage tail protein [Pseudomonas syringae]|uniref:phage tail-collar fiber domain-containing protein n=1 Tax=Pseudomonas syringae TaxID=317 RepID=UPI00041E5699|nr:phage tail protein [Pseudomonas syringae]